MRHIMLLITLGFSACSSINDTGQHETNKGTLNWEDIIRATGEMGKAWYECGTDEKAPLVLTKVKGFAIVVDTTFKAKNFISDEEHYWRDRAGVTDTANFQGYEGWNELSVKEKLQLVRTEGVFSWRQADSVHALNNNGRVQVWVINNTQDTISLQIQDGSFVCILQTKFLGGWRPIEYWRFSWCGNSYYHKRIQPGMANSCVVTIPNRGNFKTRLRYKLMGKDRFFYSNEFDGTIDKHEFVEKPHPDSRGGREIHTFKLDTLIQLVDAPIKINLVKRP
jgi:hypothetical protein